VTMMRGAVRSYVLHDRSVPACLRVSRALRLPLWGLGSAALADDEQLVVVVSRATQVRRLVDAVRRGTATPPKLVVAWGIPERQTVALLTAGLATVDGSILTDPSAAKAALDGGWDQRRFADELALAEALAELESHLVEEESRT
jgi:hypothetical protein